MEDLPQKESEHRKCDPLTTIYCEVESKPNGWADEWFGDCEAEIVWGYKK